MNILIKDELVDLECPIYMSEKQRHKFIEGMKLIFKERVAVENIIENKKEMDNVERHSKKFTEEDEFILADPSLSNTEVARKLGKSPFAIQMKRGPFLMGLQEWAKNKGKHKITDKEINEFISDQK